jgi:hypothetical protein
MARIGTVYMVHGFLGAGKTTLATLIADGVNAVLISADEWYMTLFGAAIQIGIDLASEARMRNLLWRHWPQVAAAGADIVLDFGFWTREERDRVRATCAQLGAEVVLFEVVTGEATALARCLARNKAPDGHFIIDERTYRQLRAGFEPLQADERRLTVHT